MHSFEKRSLLNRCVFALNFNRQCSECDPSDDDGEMEVDPEDTTPISQGRQRRIIKEPSKFTPDKGEVRQEKCKLHTKERLN